VATAADAPSATINQLFAFPCPLQLSGSCSKGYAPNKLLQASDGNFYGAAQLTTIGSSNPQGGTLFKVTPQGQFKLLFTFSPDGSGNYTNGNQPATALVEANDGFLYGASFLGGAHDSGVLFRISKAGTGFQLVHSFCSASNCADGSTPSGLILGHDGNLYGTTSGGGSTLCQTTGCGTIFRVTPPVTFTTLRALNPNTDGASPGGMIQASDENFYGITPGSVFRFAPGGQFTVLHTFAPLGFLPTHADSPLFQAADGKLYGALSNYSIEQLQFYEIDTSGSGFQEFPSFGNRTGVNGPPSLIQASDGNLWDVWAQDGGAGRVFAMSPVDGTILKSFLFNGANGGTPEASVVQAADGKIYGTATLGGTVASTKAADGTLWTLDAGLPAPAAIVAAFSPLSGAMGSKVTIRGSNFIGTTAVTFNGVSAAFKVLNVQFLTATVPAGATSGPIAVTNAGGSTTSTQHFTVQ
jgi:uncharacterized repeat protein (TIGR03803 family)